MSGPQELSLENLDDVRVEGKGCVAARLGLLMTLYTKGPVDFQWLGRRILGELINDYLATTAIRWYYGTGFRGQWRDMRKGPAPDVAAKIAALDEDDKFDFMAIVASATMTQGTSSSSPTHLLLLHSCHGTSGSSVSAFHSRGLPGVSRGLSATWYSLDAAARRFMATPDWPSC